MIQRQSEPKAMQGGATAREREAAGKRTASLRKRREKEEQRASEAVREGGIRARWRVRGARAPRA